MTPQQKRVETLKAKLLATIAQFPGTVSASLPASQRRYLRELEKAGFITYRNEGWHIAATMEVK